MSKLKRKKKNRKEKKKTKKKHNQYTTEVSKIEWLIIKYLYCDKAD